MKRRFFDSFRAQMLLNILLGLCILIFSTAYILLTTIRMQEEIGRGYEQQSSIRQTQEDLEDFQGYFLEYLSSKSSNALSQLLVISQRIRASIAPSKDIPTDPTRLREREVSAAIGAYLDMADLAIEEKRGMDIAGYTSLYDKMEVVLGYVHDEIDAISRSRYADLLVVHERAITVSRDVQLWNLLFMLGASLFTLIFVLHAVGRINKPMKVLSASAAEISAGNFDTADVLGSGLFEIDQVIVAFNRMKRDVRSLIDELLWQRNVEKEYMRERMLNMKMEQTLRRMELYTLQAQMNPHFLFNTLNTGVQLAIMERAEKTAEYMENLATLLRHNLREKAAFVPLRHEIEGLESYFYILRVRFSHNLDLSLDCPEEILDNSVVPVSILQPLVENSVVHAFAGKEGRNFIGVRAWKEGDSLCLSVSDNGQGMEAIKVEQLLSNTEGKEGEGKVMGLENVIHRLRFFYPDEPEVIRIESNPGLGTEILMRIEERREACLAF